MCGLFAAAAEGIGSLFGGGAAAADAAGAGAALTDAGALDIAGNIGAGEASIGAGGAITAGGAGAGLSTGQALLLGSGISGLGSIASGIIGSGAATSASQAQVAAANRAAQLQANIYLANRDMLSPFIQFGTNQLAPFQAALPGLTAPLPGWSPTQSFLESTPGYQFALGQGARATTNRLAAYGMGGMQRDPTGALVPSGVLGRELIKFAEGTASQTYQQQFQNYLAQQNLELNRRGQQFNILTGATDVGTRAAGSLAGVGVQAAGQIGASDMAAGAARAAGDVGSAQAIANAIGGVGGAATNAAQLYLLSRLLPQNQLYG